MTTRRLRPRPPLRTLAGLAAVCALAAPPPARAGDEAGGRKYALLVGVSEYRASAEPRPLPGAENDVTQLRQALLGGGYKPDDATLLTCRGAARPTGANIRAALRELADRCKPEDTAILAFAGHGIQPKDKDSEPSFCPYDAVRDRPETLIPLLKVFEEVGRCPARQKLLLVGACRVDPRAEVGGAGRKAVAPGIKLTVPRDSNFVALFSCAEGQVAWEDARLRHGVFFHYAILGPAGEAAEKDGTVDVDGLAKYVRKNTKEHVRKEFDAEQEPFMSSGSGLFPILRLAASTEVQRLMRAALVAEGKGDTGAAREAYTRVVGLDRKNAEAHYRRGLLLKAEARGAKDEAKQAEKYEEAARDFDRALRYKPDMVAA